MQKTTKETINNIVWKALEKKAPSSGDGKELKEILMSISGTIVGTKGEDRKVHVKHLKSLVNKDLIKQFIGASGIDSTSIRLYECERYKDISTKRIR